jgi:hypothetical protein
MENRINIAELLKECPTGMELDCLMYDNLYFKCIREHAIYPIVCYTIDSKGEKEEITFSWYGKYAVTNTAKCVIFPKGKTTWKGFHRPFKDGDIIYNILQKKICIYYLCGDEVPRIKGCRYNESNTQLQFEKLEYPIPIVIQDYRLATEEEKAKLFNAIKENGYKWNSETKTLEKAAKLIFNNGDIVATTSGAWIGITTGGVSREFMQTYCVIKDNGKFEAYTDVKKTWCFSRFATKEERQKLFDEIKAHGYIWDSEKKALEKLIQPQFKVGNVIQDKSGYKVKITEVNIEDECYGYESMIAKGIGGIAFREQDNWELVPNKFDISALKPFDKVLVRDGDNETWVNAFFGFRDTVTYKTCTFVTGNENWCQCIPYEGNEYLLGKTDNCNDFYKTWE